MSNIKIGCARSYRLRALTRTYPNNDPETCDCGEIQTMIHFLNRCLLDELCSPTDLIAVSDTAARSFGVIWLELRTIQTFQSWKRHNATSCRPLPGTCCHCVIISPTGGSRVCDLAKHRVISSHISYGGRTWEPKSMQKIILLLYFLK